MSPRNRVGAFQHPNWEEILQKTREREKGRRQREEEEEKGKRERKGGEFGNLCYCYWQELWALVGGARGCYPALPCYSEGSPCIPHIFGMTHHTFRLLKTLYKYLSYEPDSVLLRHTNSVFQLRMTFPGI